MKFRVGQQVKTNPAPETERHEFIGRIGYIYEIEEDNPRNSILVGFDPNPMKRWYRPDELSSCLNGVQMMIEALKNE
jgi:hypothetical protein